MDWFLEFVKNNPDQVNAFVALCALGISLLSIVLTIVSLRIQQIHNYKSLTPIASLPIGDYENLIEVKLRNTGVGPLIVEKFVVSKDNNDKNNIIDWMPEMPDDLDWETFYSDLTGLCVSPNEAAVIIRLSGDKNNKRFAHFRDQVRKALAPLKVQVLYKDIYDRKMPAKARDLQWFGRHKQKDNLKKVKPQIRKK